MDKFEKTGHGNYARKLYSMHMSYNPCINGVFDSILEQLTGTPSREGKDETALKYKGIWYILNGDFREEYSKCKTPLEALSVYKKNIEHRSGFSTDEV